jgi:hypothetical protein
VRRCRRASGAQKHKGSWQYHIMLEGAEDLESGAHAVIVRCLALF